MKNMTSKDFCLNIPGKKYNFVAVSSAGWLNQTNALLPQLLNAKKLVVPTDDKIAKRCSGFVQWGIQESQSKAKLRSYANDLNRPLAFIEDGFIRSFDLGLSKEPGRSIILDDLTFYYDATKPSRLETILNGPQEISFINRLKAKYAMRLIREERISKYNNTTDKLPQGLAENGNRHRILVIDQRSGDASIAGALASEENFRTMLQAAFARPNAEVVVKIHPDALVPGKASAISQALMNYANESRLKIVEESVNPYSLFSVIDEVFVVASGMGFEALLAEKPVTCFGVPYYAGWGLTTDMVSVPRRSRMRKIEDVFYVAWIMLSRYVDPKTKRLISVRKAAKIMASERRSKRIS